MYCAALNGRMAAVIGMQRLSRINEDAELAAPPTGVLPHHILYWYSLMTASYDLGLGIFLGNPLQDTSLACPSFYSIMCMHDVTSHFSYHSIAGYINSIASQLRHSECSSSERSSPVVLSPVFAEGNGQAVRVSAVTPVPVANQIKA